MGRFYRQKSRKIGKGVIIMKKFDFFFGVGFVLIYILFLCAGFVRIGIEHWRKLQAEKDYQISDYLKKQLEETEKKLQIYEKAIHIIENESSMRHNVKGKHGEYGIAQFKKKTFIELKKNLK